MEFGNPIIGEEELIRSAIRSQDYSESPANGWRIAADGTATFTDLNIRSDGDQGYIVMDGGNIAVYRAVDDALVAEMTSQAAGGFWSYEPDEVRTPVVAITGSDLRFSELDTQPNVDGNIDWGTTGGADPCFLDISSGNVGVNPNSCSSLISLQSTADPASEKAKIFMYTDDTSPVELNVTGYTNTILESGQVIDRGLGMLEYQCITATTATTTTTETVGITTGNVQFDEGRAYRITLHAITTSSVSGDVVTVRLKRTNLAGLTLLDSLRTCVINGANQHAVWEASNIITNQTGASLTTNLVATFFRASGTGNVAMFANGANANTCWIMIEDIGSADDFPNARPL